ncbi:MAG: sigma-70 family RNA polymerase sigma factor [Myxococcota bacterium]
MDERVEAAAFAALRDSQFNDAAKIAIEGYGPEIMGFLVATLPTGDDAKEVFAIFSEELWRSLPTFRAECAVRTWMYVVVRRARARFLRDPKRKAPRASTSELREVVDRVRSQTAPWRRTTAKDRVIKLRRELPDEDQVLLILRVDRQMTWKEIALVLFDEEEGAQSAVRQSARLRKRYEKVTRKLRAMAIDAGLLEPND